MVANEIKRPEAVSAPNYEISDDDILHAMKDIQGYIDITPADLMEIYRRAYGHAVERLTRSIKVTDIMTRSVYSVRTDTPLRDVAELMSEKSISGVPVMDAGGKVAGIISEKDFLVRMGAPDSGHVMAIIAACLDGKGCLATPIRSGKAVDIMTSPAITISPDASALSVIRLFREKKINRVPVVDAGGRLSGIVSRADILNAHLIGQ